MTRQTAAQPSALFTDAGASIPRNVDGTTTISNAAVAAPTNGAIGPTWLYMKPHVGGHIVRAQLPDDCAYPSAAPCTCAGATFDATADKTGLLIDTPMPISTLATMSIHGFVELADNAMPTAIKIPAVMTIDTSLKRAVNRFIKNP